MIDDLVPAQTSSDDAERSKPCADIFQAAIARLDGIEPADMLVVGDTLPGLRPRQDCAALACCPAVSPQPICPARAASPSTKDPEHLLTENATSPMVT